MDKKKYLVVGILSSVAGILLIYGLYYILSNRTSNDEVSINLESVTSSADKVDKVPILDLDIEVTSDTLPDTDGSLTTIDFKTFKKLFTTSKRSILIITRTNCASCTVFLPIFKEALSSLGIEAYEIDLDNLSSGERVLDYIDYEGTPTTCIIENGNITHTFTGKTDKETIAAFLDLYYLR